MSILRRVMMGIPGGGDTVRLTGRTGTNIGVGGSNGSVSWRYTSDGKLQRKLGSGVYTDINLGTEWLDNNDVGVGADYQIRLSSETIVLGSGSLTGSTKNSWIDISLDRTWTLTQSTNGVTEISALIEIRFGTGSVLDSATMVWHAEKEP